MATTTELRTTPTIRKTHLARPRQQTFTLKSTRPGAANETQTATWTRLKSHGPPPQASTCTSHESSTTISTAAAAGSGETGITGET